MRDWMILGAGNVGLEGRRLKVCGNGIVYRIGGMRYGRDWEL